MYINIGYFLGHICEYLLFIYYANTSFIPRSNHIKSSIISLCGYIVLCGIGLWENVVINILSFFIVNIVLLIYCYNVKLRNAVFFSLILDTLSCIGEYAVIYVLGLRFSFFKWSAVNPIQTVAIAVIGKAIYLIGILILKRFTNRKTIQDSDTQISLVIIPISTIVCLTIFVQMPVEIYTSTFLLLCITFLIINFIAFYTNARLNEKNQQLRILREIEYKNEIDFQKYNMLKEKYAELRVMAHDFNKYCKSIEGMIGESSGAALEMIRSLDSKNRSFLLVEYTDNDALNVLLTQKSEECSQNGIDFQVYIQDVSLSFINEADTVAIFANLMDNAIEASGKSAAKKIFLSIYEMNSAFTVIRLDNSADSEPVTEGGALVTSKSDKNLHGIGTVSIKQALKKYGGDIEWSYDKSEKKFVTTILISHFSKKN